MPTVHFKLNVSSFDVSCMHAESEPIHLKEMKSYDKGNKCLECALVTFIVPLYCMCVCMTNEMAHRELHVF